MANYDASSSGGNNHGAVELRRRQGPPRPERDARQNAQARIDALRAADPANTAPVPVDLVTASSSGLDPHISPAAAYYQVGRIARLRGQSEDAVRSLVEKYTEGRTLGILGEPRVNVLLFNRALDDKFGPAKPNG